MRDTLRCGMQVMEEEGRKMDTKEEEEEDEE